MPAEIDALPQEEDTPLDRLKQGAGGGSTTASTAMKAALADASTKEIQPPTQAHGIAANSTSDSEDVHSVEIPNKDSAACGVSLISSRNGVATRDIVTRIIKALSDHEYRSGYNDVTEENDGAGLRFFGLATAFFQKNIGQFRDPATKRSADLTLQDGHYAVGAYFLPKGKERDKAKHIIEGQAAANGLRVAGWRNMNDQVNKDAVSEAAWNKKPSLWQAILVPAAGVSYETDGVFDQGKFEDAVIGAGVGVVNKRIKDLNIVSQSSYSIVYKGMIRAQKMGEFWNDLNDPDFTAKAAYGHSRFATNTDPFWNNAQPAPWFLAHNGEINSAGINASQMDLLLQEARDKDPNFTGINPNRLLSDSLRLDGDIYNTMKLRNCSFEEAFIRLMPPPVQHADEQTRAMLEYFRLVDGDTPRNGPAFVVAGHKGTIIAKLDDNGLRPARTALTKEDGSEGLFIAGSDDFVREDEAPIKKGNVSPGGMVVLTPDGQILDTDAILKKILTHYTDQGRDFVREMEERVIPLEKLTMHHAVSGFGFAGAAAGADDVQSFLNTSPASDPRSLASGGRSVGFSSPQHGNRTGLAQPISSMLDRSSTLSVPPPPFLAPGGDQGAMATDAAASPAPAASPASPPPAVGRTTQQLNKVLFSAYWDHESWKDVVKYMAENGKERMGAMGDDTNPLHDGVPPHISYFFHQLFAQISSPPLDSVKERARFTLVTTLRDGTRKIKLDSPILGASDLQTLEGNTNHQVLDITFKAPAFDRAIKTEEAKEHLDTAMRALLVKAEEAARNGGTIILSDRKASEGRVAIPDMLAVARIRRHLEKKGLMGNCSIVADSYQIAGPHQALALLSVGANAIYARGAYEMIAHNDAGNPDEEEATKKHQANYKKALEECLYKTMGKIGVNDVNNYINGAYMAALGIDLDRDVTAKDEYDTSLASTFPGIYSPLRGIGVQHIAASALARHREAHRSRTDFDFSLLPQSGYFMPTRDGIKHGFGPEVVNAVTGWIAEEETLTTLYRLDQILTKQGDTGYIRDRSIFQTKNGFLNPEHRDAEGLYLKGTLNKFRTSKAFRKMAERIQKYSEENPTSLSDYLRVARSKESPPPTPPNNLQSNTSILGAFSTGSMSQGALTVDHPDAPSRGGAWGAIAEGANGVRVTTASGEGGEKKSDLRSALLSAKSKQVASGRFGISALMLSSAVIIEIKAAQGAKPGEGGEVPGYKVTIRYAAQRGSLPGISLPSPPPHHDIYSIEDLEQLIHDIKSVNPDGKVAVKLVASEGIETIAAGVVKAGADEINIAGNSGGTGAAQQSSIKHSGMPAEIGLVAVHRRLQKAGLRDLVKLRVSGGFKTPEQIIKAAILGADLFEFGTMAMLMVGCVKLNTCNESCTPGVATDGHLFKGNKANVERYFANMAAAVKERLKELGVNNLSELKGRYDLISPEKEAAKRYDFSAILPQKNQEKYPVSAAKLAEVKKARQDATARPKEDVLIPQIYASFGITAENRDTVTGKSGTFEVSNIDLTTQDRSFGARTAGHFALFLQNNPDARIVMRTQGNAGQSYGFVLCDGMELHHTGTVQDGAFKSMTGGVASVTTTPKEGYVAADNTVGGNSMSYGMYSGKLYVNGSIAQRGLILCHGGEVVLEGSQDLTGEYMTSGTIVSTGGVGRGFGTGALAGVAMVYDAGGTLDANLSKDAVFVLDADKMAPYKDALKGMLEGHKLHTQSTKSAEILADWDTNFSKFKIVIPKAMDENVNSLDSVIDILEAYKIRNDPLTAGMQVWLEQRTMQLVNEANKALRKTGIAREADDPLSRLHQVLDEIPARVMTRTATWTSLRDSTKYTPSLEIEDTVPPPLAQAAAGTGTGAAAEDEVPVGRRIRTIVDITAQLEQYRATGGDTQKSVGILLNQRVVSLVKDATKATAHRQEDDELHRLHKALEALPSRTPQWQELHTITALPLTLREARGKGERLTITGVTDEPQILPKTLRETLAGAVGAIATYAQQLNVVIKALGHGGDGCSGCRSQGCAGTGQSKKVEEKSETGCPSGKPIHDINAKLKEMRLGAGQSGELTTQQWKRLREAFELQIKTSPFIAYTGAACPAPCESACTESVPKAGGPNAKRGGKPVGEPVHIKDIEWYLFNLGRSLGWLDGKKQSTDAEFQAMFPGDATRKAYEDAMQGFKPAFEAPSQATKDKAAGKEIIIVGSGPAAMEIAYRALRDGLTVHMYEQSGEPGGLLRDGIPAAKFDKQLLDDDFARLKDMGLQLHLDSRVEFNGTKFVVNGTIVADPAKPNQQVVLCVGTGDVAKQFDKDTVVEPAAASSVVQALPFLKAANIVAKELKALFAAEIMVGLSPEALLELRTKIVKQHSDRLIKKHFGALDPRGKRVLLVGGGDTAQDVSRWMARYIHDQTKGLIPNARAAITDPKFAAVLAASVDALVAGLTAAVRGPEIQTRGLADAYPQPSLAPTKENKLKFDELDYVGARTNYMEVPTHIVRNPDGSLSVTMKKTEYSHYDAIAANEEAKRLFDSLPRNARVVKDDAVTRTDTYDMVILALGFEKGREVDIVKKTGHLRDFVTVCGDAADVERPIIIGAGESAIKNYKNRIRERLLGQEASVDVPQKTSALPRTMTEAIRVGRLPRPSATHKGGARAMLSSEPRPAAVAVG